jgi:hypothetical protein
VHEPRWCARGRGGGPGRRAVGGAVGQDIQHRADTSSWPCGIAVPPSSPRRGRPPPDSPAPLPDSARPPQPCTGSSSRPRCPAAASWRRTRGPSTRSWHDEYPGARVATLHSHLRDRHHASRAACSEPHSTLASRPCGNNQIRSVARTAGSRRPGLSPARHVGGRGRSEFAGASDSASELVQLVYRWLSVHPQGLPDSVTVSLAIGAWSRIVRGSSVLVSSRTSYASPSVLLSSSRRSPIRAPSLASPQARHALPASRVKGTATWYSRMSGMSGWMTPSA